MIKFLLITRYWKLYQKIVTLQPNAYSFQSKLKGLYCSVVSDAEKEEELIRKALSKIYEIRVIRHERRIQVVRKLLFRVKATFSLSSICCCRPSRLEAKRLFAEGLSWKCSWLLLKPFLCGSVSKDNNHRHCAVLFLPILLTLPRYFLTSSNALRTRSLTILPKLGDIVAALVKSTDGDENWILAEVVQYLASSGRYEVDDIDEEQKERHTLSKRRVIPLPLMRANPETDPEALFPKGATGKRTYIFMQNHLLCMTVIWPQWWPYTRRRLASIRRLSINCHKQPKTSTKCFLKIRATVKDLVHL